CVHDKNYKIQPLLSRTHQDLICLDNQITFVLLQHIFLAMIAHFCKSLFTYIIKCFNSFSGELGAFLCTLIFVDNIFGPITFEILNNFSIIISLPTLYLFVCLFIGPI